jgi:hypothetical protein
MFSLAKFGLSCFSFTEKFIDDCRKLNRRICEKLRDIGQFQLIEKFLLKSVLVID